MREKVILVGSALYNWSETQRMTEIADELVKRGYTIVFMGEGKFDYLLENKNYIREIPDYDEEWFTPERISLMLGMDSHGGDFATREEAEKIIEAEKRVIEKYKPLAVLTGYRMTLTISARLCGVPSVWCLSAAVSKPYLEFVAENALKKSKGKRDPKQSYDERRAIFEDRIACERLLGECKTTGVWNDILKENGKEPFSCDLDIYTGDLNLMSDVKTLFHNLAESQKYKFIGAILNNQHIDMPTIVRKVCENSGRKKVLVSIGSVGKREFLLKVLHSTLDFDCDFFVSVIGALDENDVSEFPENYHFCEKFPLIEIMSLCDAAIVQGGQGTLYAALAAKCPILSLPVSFEQRKNAENLFENYGCGELLRSFSVSEEHIKGGLEKLLSSDEYKKEMSRAYLDMDKFLSDKTRAARVAADYIEEFTDGKA